MERRKITRTVQQVIDYLKDRSKLSPQANAEIQSFLIMLVEYSANPSPQLAAPLLEKLLSVKDIIKRPAEK